MFIALFTPHHSVHRRLLVGPAAPESNSMAVPSGGIPSAASGQTDDLFLGVAGGQWNHQQFPHPTPGSQPPAQPFVAGRPLGVQV